MGSKGENVYLLFSLGAFLILICQLAIHALSWFQVGVEIDLVDNSLKSVWDRSDLDIVDVNWLFYIWVGVYLLQLVWILYGTALLCRRVTGSLWLFQTRILSAGTYVAFCLSSACAIGWMVLFTADNNFKYSILLISGAICFAYITVYFSIRGVLNKKHLYRFKKAKSAIADIKILTTNSIAVYATWCQIILIYSTLCVLKADKLMDSPGTGYLGLSLILVQVIIVLILDVTVGKKYSITMLAPYFLYAITMVMALYRYFTDESPHFILPAVVLAAVVIAIVIKIIFMIRYRRKKRQMDNFSNVNLMY